MMSEMATALGRKDEATRYDAMASDALSYIRKEFVQSDGMLPDFLRGLQTPALFALKLGILDKPEAVVRTKAELLKNIKDHGDCLQTGFLGTSILMDTLTYDVGAVDVAYTLLLQHKNPSWLYSVDQGATTIWERWNSYVKATGFGPVGMNSFNHYAYGAVLSWMYGTMAGIREGSSGKGFKEFILAPLPDRRVGNVDASFNSPYGVIRSSWSYGKDGSWTWNFTVPPNTVAHVTVPGGKSEVFCSGIYTKKVDQMP
jgi:alpha-L-rhamnosidase